MMFVRQKRTLQTGNVVVTEIATVAIAAAAITDFLTGLKLVSKVTVHES